MNFLMISLLALLLSACGGSSSSESDSSSESGTLTLRLTDAPVDGLSAVWVTFTEVIIHPADGSENIIVDVTDDEGDGMSINLLDFTGGESVRLLDDEPLPAGDYSWMRLVIDPDKTTVVCEETPYDCHDYDGRELNELLLDCPSCEQSGLKLNRSFEIADGGLVDFTVEFDLRKSVTLTRPNSTPYMDEQFKLRPTLRTFVTGEASARIYGTVDASLVVPVEPATQCAVYVYEGGGVEPDDNCINDDPDVCSQSGAQSLTAAEVILEETDPDLYTYLTGFLYPGLHTVALLCEYDDPELDDVDVGAFIGEATVDAQPGPDDDGDGFGDGTEHNFVAP